VVPADNSENYIDGLRAPEGDDLQAYDIIKRAYGVMESVPIRRAEAERYTKMLAEKGIFAGPSSGAVLAAAAELEKAKKLKGGRVVCLFADAGWKYLSSLYMPQSRWRP
jgi:cysteine synthase